jgi:hypothetical protein
MIASGWEPDPDPSSGAEFGDKFACTFCHSNPANDPGGVMVNALDDFAIHGSIHFVGKKRDAAGTDTTFEFVSNVDGIDYSATPATGNGSLVTDELDCIDCHDPALLTSGVYPNHADPATRGGNPFMLRDVSSMDNFCRGCHGSTPAAWWTARGKDPIPALPHAESNLTETDATVLKTSTCTDCHDIHYSGNVKLFNDGKDDTAVTATNCTEFCHYPGDEEGYTGEGLGQNTYTRHGHGKDLSTYKYDGGVIDYVSPGASYVTLEFACTRCHINLDTSDTSSNRKPHIENPSSPDPKDDYVQRFNLDTVIQGSDSESSFGNLIYGICFDCHASYDQHTGGPSNTGCLDCHDEHGEGSGPTSNMFMIPQFSKPNGNFDATGNGFDMTKAGTEPVFYETPRKDPVGVSRRPRRRDRPALRSLAVQRRHPPGE